MNKKNIIAVFIAIFSLFSFSCSGLFDDDSSDFFTLAPGKAYIFVNVENQAKSATRTLLPSINVTDLVLSGQLADSDQAVYETAATIAEMEVKQIEVQTGLWNFTLTAKVAGANFKATASKAIESGSENKLAFTLEPDNSDETGAFDFSLTFSGTEGVAYDIISKCDGSQVDSKSITGSGTYTYSNAAISSGTHTLQLDFYLEGDNTKVINTYQTIVRIEKGMTTKAEIKNISLNQIYSITYNNIEDDDITSDTLVLKFFRKSESFPLPTYTSSIPNLKFTGWFNNPDFTGEKIIEIDPAQADSLKDYQLYAKWIYSTNVTIGVASNYNFTFMASSKFIKPNKSKDITIKPAVKRGSANILYDGQNKKIDGNDVAWTFALYNDGSVLSDAMLVTAATEDGIKVTIPALYADTYSLYVCAELKNVKYATEFVLTPPQSVDASSVISQINNAAVDSVVKVEGILDEEKFAQIAEAAGTKSITLDLSDTEGLTKVPNNVFKQGSAIQGIILPEGVTTIEDNAFWCLYGLKKLHIPASVTSIDMGAFFLCATNNGLDVTLGEGSETFDLSDDFILTKDHKKIVLHAKGTSTGPCIVPNYVEKIGDYSFVGSQFNSISFEDNSKLKKIGKCAFQDCKRFSSITIPDSVEEIGDSAFRYCNNLSTVNLPKGNYKIVEGIISFCDKVQTLKIPEGVTTIKSYAFSSWAGFRAGTFGYIYLPHTLETIGNNAFNGVTIYNVYYNGTAEDRARIESNILDYTIKAKTWTYQQ